MKKLESLYFIAIIPPDAIEHELYELKKEISIKYGSSHALRSPAHITLQMPFKWKNDKEKFLIERLDEFSFDKEVHIEVKNFDGFTPRVVYADIVESENLYNLWKGVTDFIRSEMGINNASYRNRGFKPHITLAFRDLKKPVYYEIMKDFTDRELSLSFTTKSFYLLRHTGKKWEKYREFQF